MKQTLPQKEKYLQQGKEAYELHEEGYTWAEVGEKMNLAKENARTRARRYAGVYRAGQTALEKGSGIEKIAEKKVVLEEALSDYGLSRAEFTTLLSSLRRKPIKRVKVYTPQKTKSVKLLVISDTHIGHQKFKYELWDRVVAASMDCDMILHPGDHLEGMSGRPGHVYELLKIGFQEQLEHCIELYEELNPQIDIYGIDGNHDDWYKKKNSAGVIVGEELDARLPRYHHLGQYEGELTIDGLRIKLFHANDGTAYANSYKLQKLVESFTGGEKPHVVFSGHYHKSLYQFIRNVHAYESGTLLGQSEFMRGKKIPAHIGFWKVIVAWNDKGVDSVTSTFYPGYE